MSLVKCCIFFRFPMISRCWIFSSADRVRLVHLISDLKEFYKTMARFVWAASLNAFLLDGLVFWKLLTSVLFSRFLLRRHFQMFSDICIFLNILIIHYGRNVYYQYWQITLFVLLYFQFTVNIIHDFVFPICRSSSVFDVIPA